MVYTYACGLDIMLRLFLSLFLQVELGHFSGIFPGWMLCRVAAVKSLPHSSIVQIIFYFWSFEIMECILRTWK